MTCGGPKLSWAPGNVSTVSSVWVSPEITTQELAGVYTFFVSNLEASIKTQNVPYFRPDSYIFRNLSHKNTHTNRQQYMYKEVHYIIHCL